jgi:hypothetical protein
MTIYVQITGRLGNHLFQIATGYALSKDLGTNFVMVFNSYNKYEQEYIPYFTDVQFTPLVCVPRGVNYYSEKRAGVNCFQYNPQIMKLCKDDIYLDGYFQHQGYFEKYVCDLRRLFLKNPTFKVEGYFIHVRRGDYVNHPVYTINYDSYFRKAIEYFPKDAHFYICSDDINFCKQSELFTNIVSHFIDTDPLDTLAFMAGCRGGICANSSFSWWGAFLGGREIITMPAQWINNGMEVGLYFDNVIVL